MIRSQSEKYIPTLIKNLEKGGVTNQDLEVILPTYKCYLIKKNEIIQKPGQSCNAYYIVAEGMFRSYVIDYEGNEVTTNFFLSHDLLIDETAFFMRTPTQEYIQAIDDGVIWKKEYAIFQLQFNELESYRNWGRAHMVEYLFKLKQRTLKMITSTAKERYLELIQHHNEIIMNAPQKYIASFLGITESSLSRIRKELAG